MNSEDDRLQTSSHKLQVIEGLNHITLSVRDLDASFDFYRDVLGFRPLARWANGAYLLAGATWICLALDPNVRAGALPEETHIAFTVPETSFDDLVNRITTARARIWRENRSEGRSLYFLDPDGHKLEIHVGDWRSRMAACRAEPFSNMVFFD